MVVGRSDLVEDVYRLSFSVLGRRGDCLASRNSNLFVVIWVV